MHYVLIDESGMYVVFSLSVSHFMEAVSEEVTLHGQGQQIFLQGNLYSTTNLQLR